MLSLYPHPPKLQRLAWQIYTSSTVEESCCHCIHTHQSCRDSPGRYTLPERETGPLLCSNIHAALTAEVKASCRPWLACSAQLCVLLKPSKACELQATSAGQGAALVDPAAARKAEEDRNLAEIPLNQITGEMACMKAVLIIDYDMQAAAAGQGAAPVDPAAARKAKDGGHGRSPVAHECGYPFD